jgi:hypothetical protein
VDSYDLELFSGCPGTGSEQNKSVVAKRAFTHNCVFLRIENVFEGKWGNHRGIMKEIDFSNEFSLFFSITLI